MSTPRPELVQLFCADAVELLSQVGPDQADLVFMDPPFNYDEPYSGGVNDRIPDSEFRTLLSVWLDAAIAAVKPTGSLWVHLPDEWAADTVVHMRKAGLKREGWIIWAYRFGQCQQNRFIRSKAHGLWFSKGAPKFYPERVQAPSDRAAIYNDPRSETGQRIELDVWGFDQYWGRVTGNSKERRPGHPNQLPELYLKRIIEATTDEGDLVVDPFCGSGTTPTVASALGRRCVAGDKSEMAAQSAWQRVCEGAVRC